MLLTMRALTEGGRALSFIAAAARDQAHHHPDAEARAGHRAMYEFLVPIVKGFCTESAVEVASLGIQVHGGMGYIEETGAAQHYRDARILPIYEGTTAIQANDLIGRKLLRDGGATARGMLQAMRATLDALQAAEAQAAPEDARGLALLRTNLAQAMQAQQQALEFMGRTAMANVRAVFAGSVPFLMLNGVLIAGWQMARAALACRRHMDAAAGGGAAQWTEDFLRNKLATALFYGAHILPRAVALSSAVQAGLVTEACANRSDIA
jgi:hypothetical protein